MTLAEVLANQHFLVYNKGCSSTVCVERPFFMCGFEEKVRKNLIDCEVCPDGSQKIGVAVSGGADSVSLLLAVSEILFESGRADKTPLYVITVNHNIRPAEESRGDVDFVLEVCEKLRRDGHEIICEVVELERGAVADEAQKRDGGTEDAARALRHAAFDDFVAKQCLDALCLAHNRNDQLETVLMRFLQGSPAEAASGIKARRGRMIRPLLNIERHEIEEYVTSRGFTWRTDKTNFETDYLRNKIRLNLVPFLDENFEGWQKAVLAGAEKANEDAAFIQSCVDAVHLEVLKDGSVEIPLSLFLEAPDAIKYRILLEACNRAGETSRIPHQFLKDVISAVEMTSRHAELVSASHLKGSRNKFGMTGAFGMTASSGMTGSFGMTGGFKHFGSIDIIKEKNKLFVKKHAESNTDLCFSDIIEQTGTFEFPFGILSVFNCVEQGGKNFVSVRAGDGAEVDRVPLPFCVRNVQQGDTVLCADGKEKKVSDVFSDWHVPVAKRPLVPVIQILNEKSQRIKAVLGGFLGYKDWIVKL